MKTVERSWQQRGEEIQRLSAKLLEEQLKYAELQKRYDIRGDLLDDNTRQQSELVAEIIRLKAELKDQEEILDELYKGLLEIKGKPEIELSLDQKHAIEQWLEFGIAKQPGQGYFTPGGWAYEQLESLLPKK